MKEDLHRYDDMLDMPAHKSGTRRPMARADRAAQFAPFAALKGYEDMIVETARLTDDRIDLSESAHEALDEKMQILVRYAEDHPTIEITRFQPDETKEGGSYITETVALRRIDDFRRAIETIDRRLIPLDDIIAMEGELFKELE